MILTSRQIITHGLGIPYMGSKRQLADKIATFILSENPNAKHVYDLFGGGGAISFEFLQRGLNVTYNELNTGVAELLKHIIAKGITPEMYQWVSREEFNAHKNDDTWYGGLLKTCWSFGNNQRSYLFGKDIEAYKKNYHLCVVNGIDTTEAMSNYASEHVLQKYGISQKCNLIMPTKKDYQERRLEIRAQLNVFEQEAGKKLKDFDQWTRTGKLNRNEAEEQLNKWKKTQ